jgi:hypothetical protein
MTAGFSVQHIDNLKACLVAALQIARRRLREMLVGARDRFPAHPQPSRFDLNGMIQSEPVDSCSSFGSLSFESVGGGIDFEMLVPAVLPWIKKGASADTSWGRGRQ